MNRILAVLTFSLMLIIGSGLSLALADTSPPVLVGFSFTPASIDVSSGAANVTCTMHVTDAPAGATEVNARFVGPIVHHVAYCYGTRISGTPQDGTWQGVATIPRYAEGGTWTAAVYQLNDAVGNWSTYSTTALQQAGFPTDLNVTSTTTDTSGPTLTGFSFSPQAVDVGAGSASVTCTMQVIDAPVGATEVNARFVSPIVHQAAYCYGARISGTPQNGTWRGVATIPRFAETGTWKAAVYQLDDAIGNWSTYSTAALEQGGYATDLTVTSTGDTSPPTLTSFSFAPQAVDISLGSATVACTMHVIDAPAGATQVNARFVSAIHLHTAYCSGTRTSGTAQDGTWQGVATIPQYSEEGRWKAGVFQLVDAAANTSSYSTAALQQAGFPIDLDVGFVSGAPVAAISHPADGSIVHGNSVTVRARLSQGSPSDVSPTLGLRFEYRLLPSGTFVPIPAAHENHPNPDTTSPYFIHWNVSTLSDGNYAVRAVAHALNGAPDPAPHVVTITIDHDGIPVVDENVNGAGRQQSLTTVESGVVSRAISGDLTDSSAVTEVVLPPGGLSAPSDRVSILYVDPVSELPKLDEPAQSTGIFVDFSLTSGQSTFFGGLAPSLDIGYSDRDNDGMVDGTAIHEEELELHRYDAGSDSYFLVPSIIMTAHNVVHAEPNSSGRFAVTGPQLPKLRFEGDKSTLTWAPIAGVATYNVYRGRLVDLIDVNGDGLPDSGYGVCQNGRDVNLADTVFSDPDLPDASVRGYLYLVSCNTGGAEGSLGSTSGGIHRTAALSCP